MQPGDEWYIHAFWELSTTRAVGFAPGPVPWHHVVDYAERAGLDEGMIAVAVRVIRKLDYVYLDWSRKEQERKSKQTQREYDRGSTDA